MTTAAEYERLAAESNARAAEATAELALWQARFDALKPWLEAGMNTEEALAQWQKAHPGEVLP